MEEMIQGHQDKPTRIVIVIAVAILQKPDVPLMKIVHAIVVADTTKIAIAIVIPLPHPLHNQPILKSLQMEHLKLSAV